MSAAFDPSGADPVPFITEAEQAVLGTLLVNSGAALDRIESAGGADLFYDPVHRDVYEAIRERVASGVMVSPVTLRAWAEGHATLAEVGGPQYLVRLSVLASSQPEHYIGLLADLRDKRALVEAMDAAHAAIAGDEAASVIAGRLEAALIGRAYSAGPRPTSMLAAVTRALKDSYAAWSGEATDAVPSGFHAIDRLLGGFYPGEMTLIGGRPSMGKSALALSIALNAARAGKGVVIASLEMTPEALAVRAISEATSQAGDAVPYNAIRRGSYSQAHGEMIKRVAQEVAQLPIQFLGAEYTDIGALAAGVRQTRRQLGDSMALLIVDYAQLLKGPGRGRVEEITNVSMMLKNTARQLELPVVALSQLSRQVESRDDKRPMLSDLRESGQLEQDADAVMFCYREEYYLEREQPDGSKAEALERWQDAMDRARHRMDVIVAKARMSEIGTARLRCALAFNRVWED